MTDSNSDSSNTKARLTQAMKDAMKNKDKERLGAIRLALAAFKQIEVDERIEVSEERAIVILDKMLKQRKDSFEQFTAAGREDLAKQEAFEMKVIQEFLPEALSDEELDKLLRQALSESGASSIKDMGKVMAILKPQVQGKADMSVVGAKLKAALS